MRNKKIDIDLFTRLCGYVQYELDSIEVVDFIKEDNGHLALDIVRTLIHDIEGTICEDEDSGFLPKCWGYQEHCPTYVTDSVRVLYPEWEYGTKFKTFEGDKNDS